jgi:hypothetical protein
MSRLERQIDAAPLLLDVGLVVVDDDLDMVLGTQDLTELIKPARTQLLNEVAWTVPTFVGKTLYVRDRTRIVAVDLG